MNPIPPESTGLEIVAQGIDKSFGEQVVLRDVNLRIRRGEIVAIVGASGSGKTVLLDILTGLMRPDMGTVHVCDHSRPDRPMVDIHATDWERLDAIRLHWAIVFQRNALFSGTVLDNIALWFREHTHLTEEEIERRTRESLKAALLDPDKVIGKSREALSGGMAKRVAIARAIAVDPCVAFYDEPTTGLDPMISAHIHGLINSLHQRLIADGSRRTTVVVTHDKELLRRIRPRVVMLSAGRVCFDGSYDDFVASMDPGAREYLREMPVLNARQRP